MTMKNQFELVTASFNDKEKPVWASFLRNLFVCVMHNNQWEPILSQEEPVWASHSQFQWQWKTSLS